MKKKFWEVLEERCGLESCTFLIPHIFLPPRFKSLSKNSNMIIHLNTSMEAQIKWEKSRADEYIHLTPSSSSRLIADVLRNLDKYKKDLKIFQKFLKENVEEIPTNPREKTFFKPKKDKEVIIQHKRNKK